MTLHVFTGPTIDAGAVRAELDAEVRGPARFGDVYRAAKSRPTAIAIVDGYFERVPAVWHKEILWAMAEGVHVFGAGSMGALRAAELADFGMVGVGVVYEAFRRGDLEDDDEVAVAHGSSEQGYARLSDAMVNIRATIEAAKGEGVLSPAAAEALIGAAKRRFYADRSFAAILAEVESGAIDAGLAAETSAFRRWLPSGQIDQKRLDAAALLRHLAAWAATKPPPKRVTYRFEPTDAWEEATRTLEAVAPQFEAARDESPLEEELMLAGVYRSFMGGAVARGAAIESAARAGATPDDAAVNAASAHWRRERGLHQPEAFDRWRQDQRLEREELGRFFHDQARVLWATPMMEALGKTYLVDHLRANDDYARFASRAEAKEHDLRRVGALHPSLSDVGMTEPELWAWYFDEVLRTPMADDLEAFALSAGFRGKDRLRLAVLRELQWRRSAPEAPTPREPRG